MKTSSSKLVDVKTAAERLGVSSFTVRAWIRQRRLAHAKLGRRVLISEDALERFVAQNTVGARETEVR